MKKDDRARLFHDLRAPLARARTYGKLIADAKPEELAELVPLLNQALQDLEARLSEAEES